MNASIQLATNLLLIQLGKFLAKNNNESIFCTLHEQKTIHGAYIICIIDNLFTGWRFHNQRNMGMILLEDYLPIYLSYDIPSSTPQSSGLRQYGRCRFHNIKKSGVIPSLCRCRQLDNFKHQLSTLLTKGPAYNAGQG